MLNSTQIVVSYDPKIYRGRLVCCGKCGILQFSGSNLRNGASYALDNYRTLTGNYIRRIEWYHLQALAYTVTGSARNRVRNPSNSAPPHYRRVLRLVYSAISASAERLVSKILQHTTRCRSIKQSSQMGALG